MSLIDRLQTSAGRFWHGRAARRVLDTPPVVPAEDGVILFSMIGTEVVLPYLVAVKSLHRQLQRGRVVLLDDGSLTAADRAVLDAQLGRPEIIPIASVNTGPCPRGGTWERLLTILDRRADDYVIQLDSDTVTLGPVPQVARAIEANRSFTLSGGLREAPLGFLPVREFVPTFWPQGATSPHIQAAIESRLAELPQPWTRRYARGCSGFAGFARGGPGRAAAEGFSVEAEQLVGARWQEWGTEQVTSNYVIGNERGAELLRYDHYTNYWNAPWDEDARFVHFVGAFRYAKGAYRRATIQAIELLAGASEPAAGAGAAPLPVTPRPRSRNAVRPAAARPVHRQSPTTGSSRPTISGR